MKVPLFEMYGSAAGNLLNDRLHLNMFAGERIQIVKFEDLFIKE